MEKNKPINICLNARFRTCIKYLKQVISLLFQDGYAHNWHFDESHWSTTLMLQQPEQGGEFQFTKPFRNEDNEEETYEVADSVLAGDKDHVNTLEFHPGKILLKILVILEKI